MSGAAWQDSGAARAERGDDQYARPVSAALVVSALASRSAQPREIKVTIDLTAVGQAGERITFIEARAVQQLPRAVLDEFHDGIVDPKAPPLPETL